MKYIWPVEESASGWFDTILWWEAHRGGYVLALLLTIAVLALPAAIVNRRNPSLMFALASSMGMQLILGGVSQRLRMTWVYTAGMYVWQGPIVVASRVGELFASYVSIVMFFLLLSVVPANIWYTCGWVADLLVRAATGNAWPEAGVLFFRAGVVFSVGFILAAFAFAFGQSALASLPRPILYVLYPVVLLLHRVLGPPVRWLATHVFGPIVIAFLALVFGRGKRNQAASAVR